MQILKWYSTTRTYVSFFTWKLSPNVTQVERNYTEDYCYCRYFANAIQRTQKILLALVESARTFQVLPNLYTAIAGLPICRLVFFSYGCKNTIFQKDQKCYTLSIISILSAQVYLFNYLHWLFSLPSCSKHFWGSCHLQAHNQTKDVPHYFSESFQAHAV